MSDILTAPSFLTCQRKTTIVVTFLQLETHYQLCRSSGNLPETNSQAPAFRTQCLSLSPNCTWLMCVPLSPPTWAWNPIHPAKCQRHRAATISFTLPARQQHSLPPVRTLLFKPFVAMAMDRPLCRATTPLCGTVLPSSVLRLQPLRAHRAACEGSQSWLKSNSSFSEKKNTPTLRILSCYRGFASCSRAVFKTSPWYLHRYMGLFKVLWGSLWKVCIKVLVLLEGLYKRC